MNDKPFLIRQPFNEQYTLLIEMESMLVNSIMKSKTEARYDFSVLNVGLDFIECRLVQLDIFIKESNNPLVKEVAEITAAFNRMFNELHLLIDQKGKVVEILNYSLIQSKWDQTKEAMESAAGKNEDIKKIIVINDALFSDPEKILKAVQANEFLQVYFSDSYGVRLPMASKWVERTNFFNTVFMDWKVSVNNGEITHQPPKTITVNTSAIPSSKTHSSAFSYSAYKQFEQQIDISKFNAQLSEDASHQFYEESGKLKSAKISKKETADPDKLFIYLNYTIQSDSLIRTA